MIESDHDTKCLHASRILDRVYLGARSNAICAAELKTRGITTVVCMASELVHRPRENAHLAWVRLPLYDEVDEWALPTMITAIKQLLPFCDTGKGEKGAALVHCYMGKSRSALVATGLLMVRQRCSAVDAIAQIRAKRPIADPNSGYRAQLDAFHILFSRLAQNLTLVELVLSYY